MKVARAIFTSAQTDRLQGYHLVARSAGIDEQLERQLTSWSPTHDGLTSDDWHATSLHCFPAGPDHLAVGRSLQGLPEYSSRGSLAVFTQLLVIHNAQLAGFDGNPLALIQAARLHGYLRFETGYRSLLPEATLPDRSFHSVSGVPEPQQEAQTEAQSLSRAIGGCLNRGQRVAVLGCSNPEQVLAAVLYTLPPKVRAQTSFATGLKFSMNRPFQLQFLPDHDSVRRQLESSGIHCISAAECLV